jgi:hypothetical protein
MIATLPVAATPIIVANQTYYSDGDIYYQPCYQGAAVNYCVVANPY